MNKNHLLNQRYICPIGADGVQYALKNNIGRLKVDHENTVNLETDLRTVAGIGIAPNSGATNMVYLMIRQKHWEQPPMNKILFSLVVRDGAW